MAKCFQCIAAGGVLGVLIAVIGVYGFLMYGSDDMLAAF